MNVKRMLIATILAVSQNVMVLPVSAEGTSVTEQSVVDSGSSGEPVMTPTDQGVQGTSNTGQLILMMNSKKMYHNGKEYLAGYPMEVKKGVSYVSIRAIVERAGFQFFFDNTTKEMIIKRGNDELRFKMNTTSYKVNGVTQTMRGKSYSAENNFMVPLTAITKALNITCSYDSVGKRVIVNLFKLPVADFKTDKDTYKMGELITYTDLSTDEVRITERKWENKQLAYFTPGTMTIRLKVTNKFGLYSTVEKTITITNEILYTQDEFNKLFMPVGEKYKLFDGSKVLSWEQIKYSFESEEVTLIRSNNPEKVTSKGILYEDTAKGKTRFLIHHVNATDKPMKMYVIATNKNSKTTSLTQNNLGIGGGANSDPIATGTASVRRYYESMQTPSEYKETIDPGESKIILDELSTTTMKRRDDVISLFADLYSDDTLTYTVIMVDEQDQEPLRTLLELKPLPEDVYHNRGTYEKANRNIEYIDLIGNTPARLLFGDGSSDDPSDPFLVGKDGLTGKEWKNKGNFGVLYHLKLYRVAPNTLITFNPRGKFYSGAIMVNDNIVMLPLSDPKENTVLFRTREREQLVDLWFLAAPGSELPVNLLFADAGEEKLRSRKGVFGKGPKALCD